MNNLINHISSHKAALANHTFCTYLRKTHDTSFSFVPRMTFFVLGFRDILQSLRCETPKTELDRMINHHCDEDADHWLWFLEDLKKLDMDIDHWGGDVSSLLAYLWSPESYCVRNLVYRVIHHIQSVHDAEEKLIIVECLEAAFAAFISSLSHLTKRANVHQQLTYFGEHHYQEEMGHAMGSWIEDEPHRGQGGEHQPGIGSVRDRYMLYVIDDIFAGFHDIFDCWMPAFEVEVAHSHH